MEKFYYKKIEKCHQLESLIGDLEIRLKALKGDKVAIEVLKEPIEDKVTLLKQHIHNLYDVHKYINQFFEVWVKDNQNKKTIC